MINSILVTVLLLSLAAGSSAGDGFGKEIKRTAKITFFTNHAGELTAEIVPVNFDGHFPRSGWIVCEKMSSDIRNTYSEKIKKVKSLEGYYRVTYKIIQKDPKSIILKYKGELIRIEPWDPPFMKNGKRNL